MVRRKDFHVRTRDGYRIAIRSVMDEGSGGRVPVLLIHGTRISGLTEFDLPVAGGSLAGDLARKGHPVYVMDARGYGRSDRPADMAVSPKPGARSLCRCTEVVRDVEAAVDHLRAATGQDRVALLGWGVGSAVMGLYATLNPEKVSHLIGYLMVYGGAGGHPYITLGSQWDDPDQPGRFNKLTFGNYSWYGLDFLDEHWNRLIPVADKDSWRDPAVFTAFRAALIDGDPKAAMMSPPMYRSPNGMLEDLWTMASRGETLFSATNLYCKVMIVRAEHDELCRAEDMQAMLDDLVNAEEVEYFQEPGTTHYMLLDRPEHGRRKLLQRIDGFLR
jgi:pimeloyl-ACP methyl ester carboxylesterase